MIKITHLATVLATSLLTTTAAFAQQFNTAKMDSFMTALETKNKGMGSICIAKDGKEVYRRAIGFLDVQGKTKANTNSRYRIGSISKMFTATLIFQLIDEKKLTPETSLAAYFPGITNAKTITIVQMLGHRSGIHNITGDEAYGNYMQQPQTQKEMLDIITKAGSDFAPDSKAEYSNSNFILLGYIVEKITGKSYAEVLKQRITSKIGLQDTYYGSKASATKNEALSFQYLTQWNALPETNMSIPGGAGAVVSSPADLDKFIAALFNGKLVSESALKTMTTIKDGYGEGMFQFPFNEKKLYGHNGSIDGFNAMLGYEPGEKLAIAYCSNGQNYPINDIMIGALSIYYNQGFTIPTFTSIALSDAELDQYTGVYSSKDMPLKITVSKDGKTLMAQATGQGAFPLESTSKNAFKFDAAGIKMEFNPEQKEMTLTQGAGKYLFTKE